MLQSSVLDWSGTTIRGGAAIGQGTAGQPFSVDALSKLTNVKPSIPLVRPSNVAIGRIGRVHLRAWPNALSLTLVSPSLAPTITPLGVLSIDLSQPAFQIFSNHDSTGAASFPMDLRSLPISFIGVHFGVQTLAASATMGPVLSAPWIKVIR